MRWFLLIFLWATPLWAEISLPSYARLNSILGPVTVQNSGGLAQVFVNGQPIAGLASDSVFLHGIYAHSADGTQSVLLSLRHRGNGCFDDWVVLRLKGNQVIPSKPFGGCNRTVLALRTDSTGLEIDLPTRDLTRKYITYRFSDRFTATPVLQNDTAVLPAGGDSSVLRWLGKHPADMFSDAAERQRFRTIMDDRFLNALQNHTSVGTRTFELNGYLYGVGCLPHACNSSTGAYAIRISDGKTFAVIRDAGQPAQIAGGTLAELPPRLRDYALGEDFR